MKIDKVINVGKDECGKEIFCRIQSDGTRLSISGIINPRRNGNADCR